MNRKGSENDRKTAFLCHAADCTSVYHMQLPICALSLRRPASEPFEFQPQTVSSLRLTQSRTSERMSFVVKSKTQSNHATSARRMMETSLVKQPFYSACACLCTLRTAVSGSRNVPLFMLRHGCVCVCVSERSRKEGGEID